LGLGKNIETQILFQNKRWILEVGSMEVLMIQGSELKVRVKPIFAV